MSSNKKSYILKQTCSIYILLKAHSAHFQINPPLFSDPPILKIKDTSILYRPIGVTKISVDFFNQVENALQLLEDYLQKPVKCKLDMMLFKCFLVKFMITGCQGECQVYASTYLQNSRITIRNLENITKVLISIFFYQ